MCQAKTQRYIDVEHILGKKQDLIVTISRRSSQPGHGTENNMLCLQNICISNNEILTDHAWVIDKLNLGYKYSQGTTIKINAAFKERKRPGEGLFDEQTLDARLVIYKEVKDVS